MGLCFLRSTFTCSVIPLFFIFVSFATLIIVFDSNSLILHFSAARRVMMDTCAPVSSKASNGSPFIEITRVKRSFILRTFTSDTSVVST